VFATDEERTRFLELIRDHKARHGVRILSYCLMGTHPHVICVAERGQAAFSAFWQVVNARYARWYNARHGRRGQVVMERLTSPRIQDDRYLLTAMRYGDMNPVKAGLVRRPKDWRWSSHRHYALGATDELVDDAPAYVKLGRTAAERRRAYRHLFATALVSEFLVTRLDLVKGPFIGDAQWIGAHLDGLPRRGRGSSGRGRGGPNYAAAV
jgi:putative transposase